LDTLIALVIYVITHNAWSWSGAKLVNDDDDDYSSLWNDIRLIKLRICGCADTNTK